MQITRMFMVQAHTEYKPNRSDDYMQRFWLNFDVEDVFYVMSKDSLERKYFVTDNMQMPFTQDAQTGLVSMDYFWVLKD